MKKAFAIFFLSIFGYCIVVHAQTPDWLWANTPNGIATPQSICTDADGDVIAIGSLKSLITFGSVTLANDTNSRIFIVKYDSSGNVLWAKKAGGTVTDNARSVCTDASGNILVVGEFDGPSITFDSITLTNSTSLALFIVKYSPSGVVLWAKSAVGCYANSVTADPSGNLIVAGQFKHPYTIFDSITLTDTVSGYYDIFIVKYDSSGNALWARREGGMGDDYCQNVCTDQNGNVFISGWFVSPTMTIGTTTFTNPGSIQGSYEGYIVKYDSAGNSLWAKSAGAGLHFTRSNSAATDLYGNVVMTGSFNEATITFGTITLTNTQSTGGYCSDVFLVKYDANGNVIWAKSAGSNGYDYTYTVAIDSNANVFINGSWDGLAITFGTTTFNQYYYPDYAIFITKYDSSGVVQCAIAKTDITAMRIATDPSGNIFVTGSFMSHTMSFGATILTNPLWALPNHAFFLAKLGATITGIEELSNHSDISIAPNPFTNETTVTFKEQQKNTTIRIADVLGSEVKNTIFSGKQFVIEKGMMQAGIYFVQSIDEKRNVVNKKIIIQ